MKKNILSKSLVISAIFSPVFAFADLGGTRGLLLAVNDLLGLVVPVLFGLSIVYFFWGVSQFILHDAGNEKTREDGKKKMMWGIVALFVFVSIYGILGAIGSAIGIDVPVSGTSYSGGSSGTSGAGNTDPCWLNQANCD